MSFMYGGKLATWLVTGVFLASGGKVLGQTSEVTTNALSLREFVERVLARNENVQIRALEYLASNKRAKAARGVFEPEFVSGIERLQNSRRNSVQQQLSLFSSPTFFEENSVYNAGVEALVRSGAKVRLGYTLRDLRNNLQDRFGSGANEYESFAGLSLVQPLLKNGGATVTMANVRLAAGESELAYQDYRRQFMLLLARAESAYWDLFLAQEQHRIREDSVRIARTLVEDNRARVQTGKSSELEVLESESGVALRRAREREARQRLVEGMDRVGSLFSGSAQYTNARVTAADHPQVVAVEVGAFESMKEAFELNPDYLAQRWQVVQENVRLSYAKNQKYPQLDLRASYGLSGLGDAPGTSFRDVENGEFRSWSVALDFRIPLGGNRKARYEYEAVQLRKRQAILGLKAVEVEIVSALDTAMHRVESTRESVLNYQQVVDFNQRLLETEMTRLDVGKTDSRRVLEVEETLSEARSASLESLVNHQKALLDWDLVRGTLLRTRNLDLTQAQLAEKTAALASGGEWGDFEFRLWMKETGVDYDRRSIDRERVERDRLLEQLRGRMEELDGAEPGAAEESDPLRRQLREKLRELDREGGGKR